MGRAALEIMADGGVNNSRCVRVEYDIQSTAGTTVQQFRQEVPPADEYTLQYDIYFESNYMSTMGGKFHGLVPRRHVTGGRDANPEQWSVRMTLRNRVPSLYTYEQNANLAFGKGYRQSTYQLQKEKWYSVSLYVKINSSPTKADGVAKIYINGKLESQAHNIMLHQSDSVNAKIHAFFFSTFLGGQPRNNPVTSLQYVRYDNFAVIPGKVIRQSPGDGDTTSFQ